MKIYGRTLIKIADSYGFTIPINNTSERMSEGLEYGKKYDLEINEVNDDGPEPTDD